MSKAEDEDKRLFGMRQVSALVPKVARPVFQKRSPASAQIMADWAAIVGPELAEICYPKRFTAGTLTVGCSGVVAMELQHRMEMLRQRINGALGRVAVDRIRFVQETPPVLTERRVTPGKPRRMLVLEGLPEGPLRAALEALGAAMEEG